MVDVPIKAYAILEKGAVTGMSPISTIQGRTYLLSEEELKSIDMVKQRIIDDFIRTLWRKGDKGLPTGRPEWRSFVRVESPKPLLPEWVDIEKWKPAYTYTEYSWRGKDAYAVRDRGRFVTWGLRK